MYPRATVDLALRLANLGMPDQQNALICGVSTTAIRHWRRGDRRNSGEPRRRRHDCPRCDGRGLASASYAYLLGLYLGDGHIARCRKDVFRLDIYCSDDWPGLIKDAADVMAAVLPGHSIGSRQRSGCTVVFAQSKHMPCLFPQHGPGMKHTRNIDLMAWQREIVELYTQEFVRGLIQSDGCRSINRVRRPLKDGDRWYEYPRYTFCNESADIRRLFTDALDRLEIAWKQMNRKTISVARREAVVRLDEFVGPKY
jgi:hypothetical protein